MRLSIAIVGVLFFQDLSSIAKEDIPSEHVAIDPVDEIDDSEPYQFEEIVVTPGRFSIADRAHSVNVLPKSEINKFPLIDNDIYRAVQIFPGVVGSDFSARFQVRGGEKDEIIVRLDGMELYEPYHLQDFGGAVSSLDLGIVSRAELITGGFGSEYGDKLSGALELFSKEANREKFGSEFGLDLINADMLLEVPISKKSSWLISVRRGYADLIIDLIEAISGSPSMFKPRYFDLYSKAAYDITPKERISFSLLYAADSNRLDEEEAAERLKSRYINGLLWAKWHRQFGSKSFSDLFVFGGSATKDRKDGVDGVDKRNLSYFGIKDDFSYKLSDSHRLKAGLQWRWSRGDYDFSENSAKINRQSDLQLRDLQAKPQGWDSWAYLQDNWGLSKLFAVELGSRYIYQNYNGKSSLSPRAAVAIKAKKEFTFRAALGLYFQPVTPIDLPIQNGVIDLVDPERANNYILSCEYAPSNKVFLRAEGYYKKLEDLTGLAQEYNYGEKSQLFSAPSSGFAKGLEFFSRAVLSDKASGYAGYAYSVAKEQAKYEYYRDSDQRHSFATNFNYAFSPSFNLNIGWRFHTGRPYTDVMYLRDLTSLSGWKREFGMTNAKRLPPYHSLDLRLSKSHNFRSWKLSWYLQMLNLYNRKNVHEYAFEKEIDVGGNVIAYLRKEEHLLPILPTFGISGVF